MCQIRCLSSIKLVKDKHNVILILVSSNWFNFLFWRFIKFSIQVVHLSFLEFQVSTLSRRKASSNHYKVSPCVFNFSFFSLFFCIGVLHGDSTWWFIKALNSFSKCSSTFISKELKHSHLAIRSSIFLPYHWRWYYVILDNLEFMLHDSHVVMNEIF